MAGIGTVEILWGFLRLRKAIFRDLGGVRAGSVGIFGKRSSCGSSKKKKFHTRFGQIEIANGSDFGKLVQGFAISPLLQEMMVYVGQMESYGTGVEVLQKLAGVEVSGTQLYRVTDAYGALLEAQTAEEEEMADVGQVDESEVVYAQMDGGMILTDEDWREVKVGRLFRENDCRTSASEKRNGSIRESRYSAYLGNYREFMNRFDRIISPYGHIGERLVFLSDGALWIKNWISEHYPQAVQILDFYHVKEHLAEFAELVQPDATKRRKWLEEQADRLLGGDLKTVVDGIRSCTLPLPKSREKQQNLINYLLDNEYRMQYKEYLENGLFIGSGAIEAAHRTVVQCRLKRSGQRWSEWGAQNMLNLRVAHMSNQWHKVVNLIQGSSAQAA